MAARLASITCATCRALIPPGKITCLVCKTIAYGSPRTTGDRVDDGIKRLSEITTTVIERILLGFADLNWGPPEQPGMPVSGVTLLAGAPGAGKSTLTAQILSIIAEKTGRPTLYVGAEESGEQVKDRAMRLGLSNLPDLLILPLEEQAKGHRLTPDVFDRWKPAAVVIDSAQKFTQTPTEAVTLCEDVKETAITKRCPFIIISQVNKEEEFAGLNSFQHAADSLMIFRLADQLITPDGRKIFPPPDPENPSSEEPFRVLLTTKNRFGVANVSTYFTMHRTGLKVFELPLGLRVRAVLKSIEEDDTEEAPESGEGIAFDEDGPISRPGDDENDDGDDTEGGDDDERD